MFAPACAVSGSYELVRFLVGVQNAIVSWAGKYLVALFHELANVNSASRPLRSQSSPSRVPVRISASTPRTLFEITLSQIETQNNVSRWSGAGDGVGMLRGGGIPLLENKTISCFQSFEVLKFQNFEVQSSNISKFQKQLPYFRSVWVTHFQPFQIFQFSHVQQNKIC